MTWCKDIERDAAVRAAEDGRDRPLPTLEEAIARPFAEAAERSSTVSKTGEGQSGMRDQVAAIVHEAMRFDRLAGTPKWKGGNSFAESRARQAAAEIAELMQAASGGGEQPRGWLTASDRQNLEEIVVCLDDDNWHHSAAFVRSLLARSTPPEVVLPDADCSWCSDYATVWRECLEAVRSSLAAAGVAVKEVSSE